MSRVERLGESGFAPRSAFADMPCPDCLDNELSPPTSSDPLDARGRALGRRSSTSCERCGGWGRVPNEGKKHDPYMTPVAIFG